MHPAECHQFGSPAASFFARRPDARRYCWYCQRILRGKSRTGAAAIAVGRPRARRDSPGMESSDARALLLLDRSILTTLITLNTLNTLITQTAGMAAARGVF